ncbi:Epstein-Barr nuclear antigen 3 [Dissostichus eleginoides]|uniref:Epstein-Barr nuclear antigen 3 n=1 Tax=Dissostichus eleginoides TaxID=100907 RepID=A0AAD9F5S7_DISEL|nr:Epstein-Barr nuclear antigen 3 [Dissostichus eleginoides]
MFLIAICLLLMASQLAALTLSLVSSAAEEPDFTRAQTTLSVCRGKPAHTTHTHGNFHLRSCPSGTAWTESL